MPVQNEAEQTLFTLFGRLHFREAMLKSQYAHASQGTYGREATLTATEQERLEAAENWMRTQPDGAARTLQIIKEADAFVTALIDRHYRHHIRRHSMFMRDPEKPVRDFSAARQIFVSENPESFAQAGFISKPSMQLALQQEANEAEKTFQQWFQKHEAVPSTRGADYGTETTGSMTRRLLNEARKKREGVLGEGDQTSESFLKELQRRADSASPGSNAR